MYFSEKLANSVSLIGLVYYIALVRRIDYSGAQFDDSSKFERRTIIPRYRVSDGMILTRNSMKYYVMVIVVLC